MHIYFLFCYKKKATSLSRGRLLHGRSTTTFSLLLLGFLDTLGKQLLVVGFGLTGSLTSSALKSLSVSLALEGDGGDKTLDLGSLGEGLLTLALGLDLTTDDVLADIIILGQVLFVYIWLNTVLSLSLSLLFSTYKELADLGGTLGTETLGNSGISQTSNILLTLLDNNEGEDREVGTNDTTTDRLSLALTGTARTVARVALGEQETNTVRQKDTLLHGETLLVVTTRDAEDVTLELITKGVTRYFLGHALVKETTAILKR
jgi:hypothetical protein